MTRYGDTIDVLRRERRCLPPQRIKRAISVIFMNHGLTACQKAIFIFVIINICFKILTHISNIRFPITFNDMLRLVEKLRKFSANRSKQKKRNHKNAKKNYLGRLLWNSDQFLQNSSYQPHT